VPSDVYPAQVVITRESAISGAFVVWTAWIDGQEVGTVGNGGSLTVAVAPGRHTIVTGSTIPFASYSEPFVFDAQPGARIDLATKPSALGRPRIWRPGAAPSRSSLSDLLDRALESPSWRRAMEWRPNYGGNPPVSSGQAATAPRPPTSAPGPPTPAPPAAIASRVIEGSRYEVDMGDETRTVDNSKSGSPTQRVVRLSREWSRTCTVDVEHATTAHGAAGLGIYVLDLKLEAERTLTRTYSATSEERETYEEEVTLNIGAHTRSEIVFSWKEIRQKGVVQLVGQGVDVQIPYEAVVGLTFDQQQIDS
jgi:hypothetical protein